MKGLDILMLPESHIPRVYVAKKSDLSNALLEETKEGNCTHRTPLLCDCPNGTNRRTNSAIVLEGTRLSYYIIRCKACFDNCYNNLDLKGGSDGTI